MLLCIIFASVLFTEAYSVESKEAKHMFPIPFELPTRNDRSEQCWIRIEDVDLTETLTVFCYLARSFLKSYIHDYNNKKMIEDDVNVSLWNEEPRSQQHTVPKTSQSDPNTIKDWKTTTVLDPIMRMRLYVSKKADCRLVMYSREGTSNYNVECEPFLFFMNDNISGSAVFLVPRSYILVVCILLVLFSTDFSLH